MRKLIAALVLALGLASALPAQQWGTWTPGRGAFGDWHWASPVADVAALALITGTPGECIAVMDAGQVYCWSGDLSDWVAQGGGTDTDDQTAAEVPITDAGGYFAGTNVETALQEVGPTMTDARTPLAHTHAHSSTTGLTTGDAGHVQFALLAGRTGGQELSGGPNQADGELCFYADATQTSNGPTFCLESTGATDQLAAWAPYVDIGTVSSNVSLTMTESTGAALWKSGAGGFHLFSSGGGLGDLKLNVGDNNLVLTGGNFVGNLTGNADTATTAAAAGDLACSDCIGAPEIATLSPADAGLGNVTNDAQTKAAVVPNTTPSSGQILVGNVGGTAYAPQAMSGDCTMASTGAITCANGGSGDVVGPSSSTDLAIVAMDGTTGKLIQERAVTISDVSASTVTVATTAGNGLAVAATAPPQVAGAQAGKGMAFAASNAVAGSSNAGAAAGGPITWTCGNAARLTSGNAAGGDCTVNPGTGIGTGRAGRFYVGVSDGTHSRIWTTSRILLGTDSAGGNDFALLVANGSGTVFGAKGTQVTAAANATIGWAPDNNAVDNNAPDTTMTRSSAGVVKFNDAFLLTPRSSPPVTCGNANTNGVTYNDTSLALCYCDGTSWQVLNPLTVGVGACS